MKCQMMCHSYATKWKMFNLFIACYGMIGLRDDRNREIRPILARRPFPYYDCFGEPGKDGKLSDFGILKQNLNFRLLRAV